MLTATFIPSATYTSGTFSISWTNLNAAIVAAGGTSITAADSVERLLYALLQLVQLKQVNGTITDINSGVKISNAGITQSSAWETSNATFTTCDIQSLVAAFRLTNSTLQAGGNVASV